MSRRSDQLRTVAQDFCKVHEEWTKDSSRNSPDETYWDAVNAVTESFLKGDMPDDCRALCEAVEAFALEVEAFDDRGDGRNPYPSDSFWQARQRIEDELSGFNRKQRELQPLETIAALRALPTPASDELIAKIYGFKDRFGNYLTNLVQKELDSPGSVLKTPGAVDGRDWVDPRLAKFKDGNAAAEQHAAIAEKRKKVTKLAKACTETPRDIWAIGLDPTKTPVSVAQASKMLGMPEEEVAQLFAQYDAEREAQLASGEVVDALTQTIRAKSAEGLKPTEIAKALGITDVKKVSAALKGWKPQPVAVE